MTLVYATEQPNVDGAPAGFRRTGHMTEERTQYTAPDEVTQLRRQVAQLDERLDNALKTINGFTDASNFQWAAYQARIKELEAAVERLEADNRRLRKLDAMPLDALRRYWVNSDWKEYYLDENVDACGADFDAINVWFRTLDGDA